VGIDQAWCPTGINTSSAAFLFYSNDLPKTIHDNSEIDPFVDDTSTIITSHNPTNFKSSVNNVFQDINRWFATNLLSLNVDKTQFMQFTTETGSLIDLNIMHKNKKIVNICNTKFLGLTLDNTFSWKIQLHPN
jgi:hypothetical protein